MRKAPDNPHDGNRAKLLDAALSASAAATEVLNARFNSLGPGKLRSWMKSPGALVTEADVEADRVIAETLIGHGVPGRHLVGGKQGRPGWRFGLAHRSAVRNGPVQQRHAALGREYRPPPGVGSWNSV